MLWEFLLYSEEGHETRDSGWSLSPISRDECVYNGYKKSLSSSRTSCLFVLVFH